MSFDTLILFWLFRLYWRKTMKLRLPQASVLGCLFFFLCAGIVYGLFSSRLPAIKVQTQADEAQIGLALLSLGVGSVIGFIGASPLLRLIQSRTMLKL